MVSKLLALLLIGANSIQNSGFVNWAFKNVDIKKKQNKSTNWMKILNGKTNGVRECQRRVMQMQKGIIKNG